MAIANKIKIIFLNLAWMAVNFPGHWLFLQASFNPVKAQSRLLLKIIKKNKNTLFGRSRSFAAVDSVQEYLARVPISDYESYRGYIEKIKNGQTNVLTKEEVIILVPTSGSSGASKLIPYTQSLKTEFNRGLSPWFFDMYWHHPGLFFGKSYWSITPAGQKKSNSGQKIKIGFEDDSDYFSQTAKKLLSALFVVPNIVTQIEDTESFYYVTLLFLLKEKDLSFISVWSPTFIALLFENLWKWRVDLLADLKHGLINSRFSFEDGLKSRLLEKLGKNQARAEEIEKVFDSTGLSGHQSVYELIWPKLQLISCWTDANSVCYLNDIKLFFPNVKIAGKGLIATEGFISLPLENRNGFALSVRSHFFEFLDLNENQNSTRFINELKIGGQYSVIVTTGGGLYRYRLGDIIEVVGFWHRVPLVKFLGRGKNISDLFGEKLNEIQIKHILSEAFCSFGLVPSFYLLAPEKDQLSGKTRYVLFIEGLDKDFDSLVLGQKIEAALRIGFHYDYCRLLGQLDSLAIFKISSGGVKGYMNRCQRAGQKIGDIKIKILSDQLNWSDYFSGKFIL